MSGLEKRTAPVDGAASGSGELSGYSESTGTSPLRQPAVLLMLEPGCAARIIPICDDDSQEPALAALMERARAMIEADPGEAEHAGASCAFLGIGREDGDTPC